MFLPPRFPWALESTFANRHVAQATLYSTSESQHSLSWKMLAIKKILNLDFGGDKTSKLQSVAWGKANKSSWNCTYLEKNWIKKLRLLIFHCWLTDFLSFHTIMRLPQQCYFFSFKLGRKKAHEITDKRPTSFFSLSCFLEVICIFSPSLSLFFFLLLIFVNSNFQVYNKKSLSCFLLWASNFIWHVQSQKVKSLSSKVWLLCEQAPIPIWTGADTGPTS